ncbi:MAG: aminoacetone oxidase family FAD-binding enzyme [Firmicutes bacterium]|nr:aminoacetone oxidase family FAD-binding enzyme [Bacillota bacterium]
MRSFYDLAVIGAGPAGITAAIECISNAPALNVLIIDRNQAPGKKLRATGNGRCNITNINADGYDEAAAFLGRMGIPLRTCASGLVYPYSESAADVVDILSDRITEYGIDTSYGVAVRSIDRTSFGFTINFEDGERVDAARVVLALGGKAGPAFGTIGDGYRMARELGHSVVGTIPVLTGIECDGQDCKLIAGNRAHGNVKLFRNGELVYEESGEIQFTNYGLSGICIFNTTRHMRYDRSEGIGIFEIKLDLCPGWDVASYLFERRASEQKLASNWDRTETADSVLRGLLKSNLASFVIDIAGIERDCLVADLSDFYIELLADVIHSLEFQPSGIRGWKDAQCTSGGVSLDEINAETCESKLVPGLYIIGELADYDGPCGGYNLTYAWCTGLKAGRAIALGQ